MHRGRIYIGRFLLQWRNLVYTHNRGGLHRDGQRPGFHLYRWYLDLRWRLGVFWRGV